jgi:hypothetical protein
LGTIKGLNPYAVQLLYRKGAKKGFIFLNLPDEEFEDVRLYNRNKADSLLNDFGDD